jgi:mono/diheme cytochrome c family protein
MGVPQDRSACRTAVLVSIATLFLAGCDEEEGSEFRSEVGPVPVAEQTPGDPELGYRILVNEPYVSCGLPYDAYRQIAAETAPEDRLPGRTGRNAELPYAATAHENDDGVEIVSSNCLTCHAQKLDGEIIVGLGNAFGDFTEDPSGMALRAGTYVRGSVETKAWEHWADRLAGIAPYIQTRTVGVNPAPNLTWALMAHRDPETLAWSNEPLIEPPPSDPLPISVPPWWGMAKKNAMFYTTIGRGDHSRFMLLASMLCVESVEEAREIGEYAPHVRAYINSLEAPPYPYQIDGSLAAEGEEVYARGCSACHGTYGAEETYPNRVYSLDEVGTDPAYATEATDGSRDRFYEWLARSPYGDAETAAPAPGYIAPPLDGIWATAPYLHNGSVPDMATLLRSETRPTYWRYEMEPRRYDPDAMGWAFERVETGHAVTADPDLRKQIYDTTLRGYGNEGHAYSDPLSDADRAALLEYLKTL